MKFDGDVIIGGDVTTGGGVTANGSSVFKKNLKVEGWLEASNLRGACKGLFENEERLKDLYPTPDEGMWALIGETIPAKVYMAKRVNGKTEWVDTGNVTDDLNIDFDNSNIQTSIDELRDNISTEISERADQDANILNAINNESRTRQSEDSKLSLRITSNRDHIDVLSAKISKLQSLPFSHIVSVGESEIVPSEPLITEGYRIAYNTTTKTFLAYVNGRFYSSVEGMQEYGENSLYGVIPYIDYLYNTTKTIYKWNGNDMVVVFSAPTKTSELINDSGFITSATSGGSSKDELATINIAGDMTSPLFTLNSKEWAQIINAYNSKKLITLRCTKATGWSRGSFIPNIYIETSLESGEKTMYMSYYIDNLYGRLTSRYDVNAGEALSTAVEIKTAVNLGIGSNSPSVNGFAQIGFSNEELNICFDDEIAYSKIKATQWDNREISNFSNDDVLLYPPLVDVSILTDLSRFYFKCSNIRSIPVLNTSSARNMSEMFAYCYSLRSIPLINTSNVENMDSMFYTCSALERIPLLDTSKVTNMAWMFSTCSELETIPALDCGNVTNTSNMFNNCKVLTEIPELDTKNVTTMKKMFSDCPKLERIYGLDFSSVTDISGIFSGCENLKHLIIKNLGKSALSFVNLSEANNWGTGSESALKSLVDSLVTYSYDRVSNGMERATIRLSTATHSLLTSDNLEAISAKGYDVVAY